MNDSPYIQHQFGIDDHGDSSSGDHNKDDNDDNNNLEWTDDEFKAYLHTELSKHPLSADYPALFGIAPEIICKWRQRYRGNAPLWKRLFQKVRVLKEFIEAVPIIDAVQRLVTARKGANDDDDDELLKDGEKYTIIDLASGRGYLSMILSELLPPDKVEKLVLVDKAWAMHNISPESHHISSAHIYGTCIPTTDLESDISHEHADDVHEQQQQQQQQQSSTMPCTYYSTWPIPLNTAKVNLKKSKEIFNMERRLFNSTGPGADSGGPIILLAVHLCGTLSIKAVELFNNNPNTVLFCLKPCCLPGIVHAKRDEIFQLGEHSFDSKLVCMSGKWNKNIWKGPCRSLTKTYFDRWAENLYLGIMNNADDGGGGDDTNDPVVTKVRKNISIQLAGGYQNEFLFAERHRRL